MPINIKAIEKGRERREQDRIMRAKEIQEMEEKIAMEEEWEEEKAMEEAWEKDQQEYADWASEHPEELEEMKIDDFYLNVAIDFEEELEVRKQYTTRYSRPLSRSDINSWHRLLGKLYDKQTIEEAFRRYGYEEKEEKKKGQVEKVLQSRYKMSYRKLLKNLEKANIIKKSITPTKQWKWNAKKIEFCYFVKEVNKKYIKKNKYKIKPFVVDFEVENNPNGKYIAQKISKLKEKTYDSIKKFFPES